MRGSHVAFLLHLAQGKEPIRLQQIIISDVYFLVVGLLIHSIALYLPTIN